MKELKNSGSEKIIKNENNEKINTKISSLLNDVSSDYTPEYISWGKPVGREIW